MSDKYSNLVGKFAKALKKFEEALNMEKTEIVRDSTIQRFEFTSELCWKLMKAYLQEKMGEKDLFFPKEIIRRSFQAGLLEDNPLWLKMVETRNKTSHMYNENMAEEVYNEIPQYLGLFKGLKEKF